MAAAPDAVFPPTQVFKRNAPARLFVDYPELVIHPSDKGSGIGDFAETVTVGYNSLSVSVRNPLPSAVGVPLGELMVLARMSPESEYFPILASHWGQQNPPPYPCVYAEKEPGWLASEDSAWFVMDVSAFHSVKFRQYTAFGTATFAMSTLLKNGLGGNFQTPALG